ncbi:MAG: hypothetical protein H6Q00_2140 [Holophagaceae bacterium]|nr:hypothetical protein [Holophagaceae bacterium]
MRNPVLTLLSVSFLLGALLACGGGGGGSRSARVLNYTNSATATASDWRLEADAATNGTGTVLLRLYGPTGTAVQGATIFLTCDGTRAQWVKPSGATDAYALEGSALDFTLGPNAAIQLFKSRLMDSNLQVGAYQKTGTRVLSASAPLFTVALSPASGATTGIAGLTLTESKAAIYLDGAGEHALELKVGTLTVR